ncbi:MAG: hypothetical protein IJ379_13145 [Lachnospiraceae bacterium]|nr:hypothetical protein [Lachnospiraceae bacterium]
MEYNLKMQRILNRVYKVGVEPFCEHTVWKKRTLNGDDFYGIADFCGVEVDKVLQRGNELTDLEWIGNELFFSEDSEALLEDKVIAAYLAIKRQLNEEYSDTEFDIVVSIDAEANNGVIRFYAIRGKYHYIEPTYKNVSGFAQEAVLVDTVNQVYLKEYGPKLNAQWKELYDRVSELNPSKEAVLEYTFLTPDKFRIENNGKQEVMVVAEDYWSATYGMCLVLAQDGRVYVAEMPSYEICGYCAAGFSQFLAIAEKYWEVIEEVSEETTQEECEKRERILRERIEGIDARKQNVKY